MRFDGRGITVALRREPRRWRISGPGRRTKVEEKMRRDGDGGRRRRRRRTRQTLVRAAVARLFIVACARAKFSDTDMYVRSDYFLPLAPRARQKSGAERRGALAADWYQLQLGASFSAAGADRSYPPRCRDSSRLITRSLSGLGATREEEEEEDRRAPKNDRGSRHVGDYNRRGYTVAV